MEVRVGGADAMASLVEGTTELAVTDGQGDAGGFPFVLYNIELQKEDVKSVSLFSTNIDFQKEDVKTSFSFFHQLLWSRRP